MNGFHENAKDGRLDLEGYKKWLRQMEDHRRQRDGKAKEWNDQELEGIYNCLNKLSPDKDGVDMTDFGVGGKAIMKLNTDSYNNNQYQVNKEKSYIMIKPDGVQRGIVGTIIKKFETHGFKLVAMKLCQPGKEMFEKHYSDLSTKPFFPDLVNYAASGPVCCMVWEGTKVVQTGRKMLGATKPFDSNPGTIRGDFCVDVGRNVIHGSDSVESANKEIALWFTPEEICGWENHSKNWVYE